MSKVQFKQYSLDLSKETIDKWTATHM